MHIHKKLIPLKAHYFFFNAATGPVVPFMPTLGKQFGFSAGAIGLIYTCLPVFGMFAKTGFGALADRYKMQKSIFLFFQVLTAVAFFGIMFIPEKPAVHTEFECGGHDSEFELCSNNLNKQLEKEIFIKNQNTTMKCQLKCKMDDTTKWDTICEYWNSTKYCESTHTNVPHTFTFTTLSPISLSVQLDSCVYYRVTQTQFSDDSMHTPFCPLKDDKNVSRHMSMDCETTCDLQLVNELLDASDKNEFKDYKYWIFFVLLALSWIGMAVVVSVGDAVCFEMLDSKPHLYGYQRLWGSIGWGLLALSAGFLVDYISHGAIKKNYSIVFYIMIIMVFFDVLSSLKLQYNQTTLSVSILHDVGKLITEIRVFVFLIWCVCIGMCTGLVWNFLFWYLEELNESRNKSMGYTQENTDHMKTLEGLLMGIQCFGGELPFFFLSSFILKKLGHINTMNLVLIGLGTRLILYSTLTSPWFALPVELLHGLSYGVFYATMASYASIVAPLGTETTIQGLVSAVFEIGVALGSLIAGKCLDVIGGAQTFRYFGIGCFVVLVIHIIVQMLIKRNGRYVPTIDDKGEESSRK
ncbi:major facilitator superfamily domain-containing protein 6 isoform X2 [Chrysoperla carnea]|uniref:major facilitator superfamily domain-containing protein 6 isoform X2 n=1 Tax=Chrysoperla carnea TaxID=189513 RepID=UPI001D065ACD|nr:major facilitator superfamily domain-containing protein 6 isoform X2 [Chrysoperla carnea]